MKDLKYPLFIVLGCFLFVTFLGYIDYETESLAQLFSDVSNVVAICFFTFVFSFLIWVVHIGVQFIRRLRA